MAVAELHPSKKLKLHLQQRQLTLVERHIERTEQLLEQVIKLVCMSQLLSAVQRLCQDPVLHIDHVLLGAKQCTYICYAGELDEILSQSEQVNSLDQGGEGESAQLDSETCCVA